MEKRKTIDVSVAVARAELLTISIALLAVCLALPLIVHAMPIDSWLKQGGDQWIMGSIVNCALVVVGVRFKSWQKSTAVAVLPSAAHIVLYFALATPIFGLYMVPAIWLGNMAIMLSFKHIKTFGKAAVVGIAVKAAIVFGVFSLLVATSVIPELAAAGMTARMGINQIIVAAIGCVIAFVILKTVYSKRTEINGL